MPVWLKLIEKYLDIEYFIFRWNGGFTNYQQTALDKLLRRNTDRNVLLIFLINTESFSYYTKDRIYHKPRGKIYDVLNKILKRWKIFWAIDQSTMIKEHNSKRTEGILDLAHWPDYKRILSGYPVLKSPSDLYSQIGFLGPNLIPYRSYYAFRNRFCITRKLDNRVSIEIGTQNLQELNRIIQPFSSRLLKKDMVVLPPKLRTKRMVEMTDEQKKYYNQMRDEGLIQLQNCDKTTFASNLLTQLEKLHQVANGVVVSLNQHLKCNKYPELVSFIQDELADNQMIIWFSYIMNIEQTSKWLSDHNITYGFAHGGVTGSNRDKVIEDFTKGNFQIMLASPALKFGLNLTQVRIFNVFQ